MARFDEVYRDLLSRIMRDGTSELNKRTAHEIRALPGLTFSVDLEHDGFPVLSLRKIPTKLFIAEQIWFISGARKPSDFLEDYTKIWHDFTNPGDVVTAAYGYRWRRYFGRDQLAELAETLERDRSSRQGVVVTWDPATDGLSGVSRGNVPCPYSFVVNIIDNRLNLMNVVRSNDMILGFPHDVAGFALLQLILAQKLGAKPGIYTHTIAHAHVYDTHYEGAEELLKRPTTAPLLALQLPPKSFERAQKKDKALVDEINQQFIDQYKPGDAITGLKVVL